MNKFVILSYGRSGSTYLGRWLNNHYEIVSLGEVIRDTNINETLIQYFKNQEKYTLARTFTFILRNPRIGFLLSIFLLKPIKEYFNFIFNDFHIRKPGKKARHPAYHLKSQGFNLPYRQLFLIWGLRKHIVLIKIIHLMRKNVLAIYISKLVGIKFNLYHSKKKIPVPRIKVPIWNLKWKLYLIKLQQKYFTLIIRKTDHIIIYYEDFFSSEKNKIKNEILSFLNVEQLQTSNPKIIKLASSKIKERVTNYEEIVKVLKGTHFEYCLD